MLFSTFLNQCWSTELRQVRRATSTCAQLVHLRSSYPSEAHLRQSGGAGALALSPRALFHKHPKYLCVHPSICLSMFVFLQIYLTRLSL